MTTVAFVLFALVDNKTGNNELTDKRRALAKQEVITRRQQKDDTGRGRAVEKGEVAHFTSGRVLTLVRRSCRFPLYQVMIALGRDPALSQETS